MYIKKYVHHLTFRVDNYDSLADHFYFEVSLKSENDILTENELNESKAYVRNWAVTNLAYPTNCVIVTVNYLVTKDN